MISALVPPIRGLYPYLGDALPTAKAQDFQSWARKVRATAQIRAGGMSKGIERRSRRHIEGRSKTRGLARRARSIEARETHTTRAVGSVGEAAIDFLHLSISQLSACIFIRSHVSHFTSFDFLLLIHPLPTDPSFRIHCTAPLVLLSRRSHHGNFLVDSEVRLFLSSRHFSPPPVISQGLRRSPRSYSYLPHDCAEKRRHLNRSTASRAFSPRRRAISDQ